MLVNSPDGSIIDIGPRGFATLSLFSRPRALDDAIDRLEADERSTDFLPMLSVLNTLIEEGALVVADGIRARVRGWADPVEHARMLDDDRRTEAYLAALTKAVRPEDVVLDIGTGTGVLAVAAARAGARHVYAVEATDIAEVAERVFTANGVDDRVTLVRGWSTQIELPERADLLVSEIIGSEPFEEEILESTLDARRRLLRPGARLIPNALTLLVRPLLIPEAQVRRHAVGRESVARWRRSYGIEFRPLLEIAAATPVHTPVSGEVAADWPSVGPPVRLAEVDLTSFQDVSIRSSADLRVSGGDAVNAVAVTFRADLHDDIVHTLDPWKWPASSWDTSVWVLPDPVRIRSGEALRVRYCRHVTGAADGLRCEVVENDNPIEETHDHDWRS